MLREFINQFDKINLPLKYRTVKKQSTIYHASNVNFAEKCKFMQTYGIVSKWSHRSPHIPNLIKKIEQKGVAYVLVFTVCNCHNNIKINNSGIFEIMKVVIKAPVLSHSTLSTQPQIKYIMLVLYNHQYCKA